MTFWTRTLDDFDMASFEKVLNTQDLNQPGGRPGQL